MADALHSRDRRPTPPRQAQRGAATASPHAPWPESFYRRLLAEADITINGHRAWDMQVHDDRLWWRILRQGTLGLGEAYADGWWDVPRLDELVARVVRARLDRRLPNLPKRAGAIAATLRNLQDRVRARQVAEQHYDLDNAMYRAMLGERMVYTCGYWPAASDLETAQAHKLELVCRKLGLTPGMRVLDIGCGWGGFARYAAERHGVRVIGVTISRAQAEFASRYCAGLPIEIRLEDYRAVRGSYDRIVSLGMFEHVGRKNYRRFMRLLRACLAPGGLALLHTIGRNDDGSGIDPWVTRHIFPNSEIPTLSRLSAALDGMLTMEDWHNFGADYDRTLMAWQANFHASWPRFASRLGSRFYRAWSYYLLTFAGVFRARELQLWQLVLSVDGLPGGYRRP